MLLTLGLWQVDRFTKAASVSFISIAVALNLVWIAIKAILWTHGYRGWFDSTKDLRRLKDLAVAQAGSGTAAACNILRYSWRTLFVLVFALPLVLLGLSWLTQRSH